MGELMGYVDQITSYGFSSTDLGNKAFGTLTTEALEISSGDSPDAGTRTSPPMLLSGLAFSFTNVSTSLITV